MKHCGVKPYEGAEKYIFISYCHKDRAFVFPVAERLAQDGYRVWYDEGIDPGSEWPEIIADHLSRCAVCIAFISEKSLNSHNCRREINFALLKKKPFISVVVEKVKMSPGMEMQLSSSQSIIKYALNSDAEFFDKLYTADSLKCCLGTPDPSIRISNPWDYSDDDDGLFSEADRQRNTFSDKWFVRDSFNSGKNAEEAKDIQQAAQPKPIVSQSQAEEEIGSADLEKTIVQHNTASEDRGDSDAPNRIAENAWLIRVKTGEKIIVSSREFKLGRSNTKCDYAILGNGAIGRFHAVIVFCENTFYLIDKTSTNKTYLNSRELIPEERYKLSNNDKFRLADELFEFYREK